ncbi:MAG: hypothetical protein LBC97_13760 [Bifidobacteriaceae bacterium]|jgi:hypothetical protein|nr:hypothetical protein [Bifidobacteriaceae bacterium]
MIEILVVILLCTSNSKAAKAQGKNGGGAVGYTIALWVGMEFLGALIGAAASGGAMLPTYGLALFFALIGGGISMGIARKGGGRPQAPQPYPYPPQAAPPYQGPAPYGAPPAPPAPQPALAPGAPGRVQDASGKSREKAPSWQVKASGGSTYKSAKAPTLYQATKILNELTSVPPNTYHLVDTPDGTLGRDMVGFFTEARIKTSGLRLPGTSPAPGAPVESKSLTSGGDSMKGPFGVAMLKSAGEYATLVLLMECGQCGYKSPVETTEGSFDRQCYACGTVNHTKRGNIQVMTPRGPVQI